MLLRRVYGSVCMRACVCVYARVHVCVWYMNACDPVWYVYFVNVYVWHVWYVRQYDKHVCLYSVECECARVCARTCVSTLNYVAPLKDLSWEHGCLCVIWKGATWEVNVSRVAEPRDGLLSRVWWVTWPDPDPGARSSNWGRPLLNQTLNESIA